jgi:hypothetical protein
MMKPAPILLLVTATLALVSGARANPAFPYFFEQSGLPEPPCTICHRDDVGGKGTVNKAFGVTMQRLGLNAESSGGDVAAAIQAAEEMNIDSDGDGMGDIAELRMNSDPNFNADAGTTAVVLSDFPLPQTGCSVLPGKRKTEFGDVFALVLLSLVALTRAPGNKALQRLSSNRRGSSDSRISLR